ncbi:EsaB/YukD family protein [Dictyobacter formicarum]|uniref:Anaphase-promoting complex subunit 4-like WD40 domain-containing protein n=1 Tax=Dictyobacter formicarum TaxID=2778368 RepID=A0ABQ3VGN7_9CHLR|nr:PD40 domain-containing protein [Dictyobacter formicarum]GHO84286.1 hypothetical protein KSZ_22920 [Dictyobacter formicarum]
MQKSEILIEEGTFGAARPVIVAMDVPVAMLLPKLVVTLQLPLYDLFGKPLVYTLRHASSGRILAPEKTLTASGILPGMRLMLDSSITEGMPVPIAPISSQLESKPLPDPALHTSETLADDTLLPPLGRKQPDAGPETDSKKPGKVSRRVFLAAFGTLCGVGGIGVGYAAYRGWLNIGLAQKNTAAHVIPHTPSISKTPAVHNTTLKARLTFTRHQQIVRTVSWAPTENLLASCSDDTHVFIWDMQGNVQRDIQHPAAVKALAWSPDSTRLVTGANTQVAFWDAANGNRLARSTHRHAQIVNGLAWATQNGMRVVSVGDDKRAVVWDGNQYNALLTYLGHTAAIEAVSWSADGKTIATASQGGVVRVWNATLGQDIHGYYFDVPKPMRALAFAPDGVQLAVGGDDGIVRIWHALICGNNGQICRDVPQRLHLSEFPIRSISWSPDARFLAVGTHDGTLTLFQVNQGMKQIFQKKLTNTVHSITWAPTSKQLATATGNQVILWDVV